MTTNEQLTTQYNQLVWQIGRHRDELNDAAETYASKVKSIGKGMKRVASELEVVSREMTRRQLFASPVPIVVPENHTQRDAGFHPQVG